MWEPQFWNRVREIEDELEAALFTCQESRADLSISKRQFTTKSLGILANYRRRQAAVLLLNSLRTIGTLVNWYTYLYICMLWIISFSLNRLKLLYSNGLKFDFENYWKKVTIQVQSSFWLNASRQPWPTIILAVFQNFQKNCRKLKKMRKSNLMLLYPKSVKKLQTYHYAQCVL